MAETKKQVRKETRVLEMTNIALIGENREGAEELRLLEELKRIQREKDKRTEEVLKKNFGDTEDDLCDRYSEEGNQGAAPERTPGAGRSPPSWQQEPRRELQRR